VIADKEWEELDYSLNCRIELIELTL
jgi:hypothetical protein